MIREQKKLFLFLLILINLVFYGKALTLGFVWDDIPQIINNETVKNAKIIDIISDKIIGDNINDLFNRKEAIKYVNNFNKIPFPADKSEREKRIAYAFEGIKCKI